MKNELLLPLKYLLNNPSIKDGISTNQEKVHRLFGCEIIQQSSIMLNLPLVVSATAQNILHRFFYRKSLLKYDSFTVAMGCVLLASKLEEYSKTLHEIISVFHTIYLERNNILTKQNFVTTSPRYTAWKNELMTVERFILKELGFSFYNNIEHPHKYLLYYIKLLDGTNELAKSAWNYLNDSMRIDLCLRFAPQVIASSAIYLAAEKIQYYLPSETNCCWWDVFDSNLHDIQMINSEILSLYNTQTKITWVESIEPVEYLTFDLIQQNENKDSTIHLESFSSSEISHLPLTSIDDSLQQHQHHQQDQHQQQDQQDEEQKQQKECKFLSNNNSQDISRQGNRYFNKQERDSNNNHSNNEKKESNRNRRSRSRSRSPIKRRNYRSRSRSISRNRSPFSYNSKSRNEDYSSYNSRTNKR